MSNPKVIPCFWFNRKAEAAVDFYVSIFSRAEKGRVARYTEVSAKAAEMNVGDVLTIDFQLCGQNFIALNADDHFQFSPAISMTVYCESKAEIDQLWAKLIEGGRALMPLDKYPFSERYGFLTDQFGVAWQLNMTGQKQKILPSFLFVGERFAQAETAMKKYVDLFGEAKVMSAVHYDGPSDAPKKALMHAVFNLVGLEFTTMDGAGAHHFDFTGAISFQILCDTQKEIDRFWAGLGDGGKEQACGWISDKFGIHWQVIPAQLSAMIYDRDPARAERALKAMHSMRKFDLAKLQQAHDGR